MKSSGTSTWSRSLKKLCHDECGRRDRMTFPVSGSFWINTSVPSNRNSEGRRTAWLRPLRKARQPPLYFAEIWAVARLPWTAWRIYSYGFLTLFEEQWLKQAIDRTKNK